MKGTRTILENDQGKSSMMLMKKMKTKWRSSTTLDTLVTIRMTNTIKSVDV